MLEAILKRKLPSSAANLEDVLTSITFGVLRYFEPEHVLLPFLRRAKDLAGNSMDLEKVVEAAYDFWPWLHEEGCRPCEPDVLIRLKHHGGDCTLVLIEAKYQSGKSVIGTSPVADDDAPHDQLAKEWGNVQLLARGCPARLVYITPHIAMPADDIRESISELRRKIPGAPDAELYWVSWRDLPAVLAAAPEPMLKQLRTVLLDDRHYGFCTFEGIRACPVESLDSYFGFSFSQPGGSEPEHWRFDG